MHKSLQVLVSIFGWTLSRDINALNLYIVIRARISDLLWVARLVKGHGSNITTDSMLRSRRGSKVRVQRLLA